MEEVTLLPASGTTVTELADSIAINVSGGVKVKLRAAGRWAINQMTKALAKAKIRLAWKGIQIVWDSSFATEKGKRDGDDIVVIETKIYVVNEGKLEERYDIPTKDL